MPVVLHDKPLRKVTLMPKCRRNFPPPEHVIALMPRTVASSRRYIFTFIRRGAIGFLDIARAPKAHMIFLPITGFLHFDEHFTFLGRFDILDILFMRLSIFPSLYDIFSFIIGFIWFIDATVRSKHHHYYYFSAKVSNSTLQPTH